jgi:hypothetical protein
MHVVKKHVAPESKAVTWEVGWNNQYHLGGVCDTYWEKVFESDNKEEAFSVCSWLNGGESARFELRRRNQWAPRV